MNELNLVAINLKKADIQFLRSLSTTVLRNLAQRLEACDGRA